MTEVLALGAAVVGLMLYVKQNAKPILPTNGDMKMTQSAIQTPKPLIIPMLNPHPPNTMQSMPISIPKVILPPAAPHMVSVKPPTKVIMARPPTVLPYKPTGNFSNSMGLPPGAVNFH